MSPRFIRSRPASSVRKSVELEEFLDSCQNEWLRNKSEDAFSELKNNYEGGVKVTKDKWPHYYAVKWGVTNLYVRNLGPDWRLTYALESDGIGISVFCLEVLTHKQYDKRFGYQTS